MNYLLFPAGVKDAPIVTPLMNFVRQKRAAKSAQVLVYIHPTLVILQNLIQCICFSMHFFQSQIIC